MMILLKKRLFMFFALLFQASIAQFRVVRPSWGRFFAAAVGNRQPPPDQALSLDESLVFRSFGGLVTSKYQSPSVQVYRRG